MNWFLDFDETLASGRITWGLTDAIPRLIEDYRLAFEQARFEAAILVAQEKASREVEPMQLLGELFETMGWPRDLQKPLMEDVLANYKPALFDDVVPFLEKLHSLHKRVFIVSNNPTSVDAVSALGIDQYITRVYSPKDDPQIRRKPHRGLWDAVCLRDASVSTADSVFVGNDPWTDGVFADNCGLACWIVDRDRRFTQFYNDGSYGWVKSLLEIPVEAL